MPEFIDPTTGYIPEDELIRLADDAEGLPAAGVTTSVPCAIASITVAASAALPGFCPTGACTKSCTK